MGNSVILITGNNSYELSSMQSTLTDAGYRVIISGNMECISELTGYDIPDLFILDDTFIELEKALQIIKTNKSPELPVIFMGTPESLTRENVYDVIDEVLGKPVNSVEVLSRTKVLLEIKDMQVQLQKTSIENSGKLKENNEEYSAIKKEKPRVLIVEDSKLQSMIMCKNLGEENFELITAMSGHEAINATIEKSPDLIILDVLLPDIDGFTVCEKIKSTPDTASIPVLIVTTLEGISNKLKGLKSGSDDYLIKPIDKRELALRVNSLLKKKQLHDEMLRNYYQAWEQSIRDRLTELYNHGYFMEKLNEEVKRSKRYERPFSLVLLDIDYFKNYNDNNGHPAGDRLLQKLSAILTSCMRNSDIIARYGGEEFSIILPETGREDAEKTAEKIRREVEHHYFPNQENQPGGNLTISLGVTTFPGDASSAAELLENTDRALYEAKNSGKNTYVIFRK